MAFLGIDLVIDVGANRGQFALEIRRAGYTGQIVSIEPAAAPFRELCRRAAGERRWTAIRSAVGSRTGSEMLHVAANDGASSSILPMLDLHSRVAPEAGYVADERVDVATLDDLVKPHLEEATLFIKADVQGYELQVLAGGTATLARSSLVLLEMSLLPLYEMAPSFREILDYMAQRGFGLVGIEPGLASSTGALLQADGLFSTEAAILSLQRVLR
jgi:FkbM family methyltransferase